MTTADEPTPGTVFLYNLHPELQITIRGQQIRLSTAPMTWGEFHFVIFCEISIRVSYFYPNVYFILGGIHIRSRSTYTASDLSKTWRAKTIYSSSLRSFEVNWSAVLLSDCLNSWKMFVSLALFVLGWGVPHIILFSILQMTGTSTVWPEGHDSIPISPIKSSSFPDQPYSNGRCAWIGKKPTSSGTRRDEAT